MHSCMNCHADGTMNDKPGRVSILNFGSFGDINQGSVLMRMLLNLTQLLHKLLG